MTLKEKILTELSQYSGLTDAELRNRFYVRHQDVNQACRDLERRGYIIRDKSSGTVRNFIKDNQPSIQNTQESTSTVHHRQPITFHMESIRKEESIESKSQKNDEHADSITLGNQVFYRVAFEISESDIPSP